MLKEHQAVPHVRYWPTLEHPQVYFGALCCGVLAYWVDLHYNTVDWLCLKTPQFLSCFLKVINSCIKEVNEWSHEHWMSVLIIAALCIISFEVYQQKKRQKLEEDEHEPLDLVPPPQELPSWGVGKPPVQSVSKISPGNFEWQSTVYTRQEIQKLTNSEEYKAHMRNKASSDLAESNWKTKEIESGKLPPDEDTMIKRPINLADELQKVDQELQNQR